MLLSIKLGFAIAVVESSSSLREPNILHKMVTIPPKMVSRGGISPT